MAPRAILSAVIAGALALSCRVQESPPQAPATAAPPATVAIAREGALVTVTGPARLVIAGDFHARSADFEAWLEASGVVKAILSDDRTVAVLLGDVVDRKSSKDPGDGDVRILARVREILKQLGDRADRFVLIQGNHEWEGVRAYAMLKTKGMTAASRGAMVDGLFHSEKGSFYRQFNFLERMDDEAFEFLRALPFVVVTDRGIVCAHAGPPKTPTTRKDLVEPGEETIREILWGRPCEIKEGGYTKEHLDRFLEAVGGAKLLVSGHTPHKSLPSGWVRNGVGTFGGRQVILATGYGHDGDKQAYLVLDGERPWTGVSDLRPNEEIRYLETKAPGK